MEERIIHEVRVIETDDGYRIEIKGDKDWIRRHGFDPRSLGFGNMKNRSVRRTHHRHPHHGHDGFMGNEWFRDAGMRPSARFRDEGWSSREDSPEAPSEDKPAGEA